MGFGVQLPRGLRAKSQVGVLERPQVLAVKGGRFVPIAANPGIPEELDPARWRARRRPGFTRGPKIIPLNKTGPNRPSVRLMISNRCHPGERFRTQ